MNPGRRSSRNFPRMWVVSGVVCLLHGCNHSPELSLPADEDAFVSYYQAVYAFASGLSKLKSPADFERQRPQIDRVAEQLRTYREQMMALSESDRRRLTQQNTDLIQKTNIACKALQ